MKNKFLPILLLIFTFTINTFAQTINPYAGSIQLKNSQSKIAVVCTGEITRFTNCSKFQFQILVGSVGSPMGDEIETNRFVLGLDQTLQNYTHARNLNDKQFLSLQDDLNRTLSNNSNTKLVDALEFDTLKDFINHYSDYAALGNVDVIKLEKTDDTSTKLKNVHIFTHASNKTTGATLYLRCKDESCETVIAIENKRGVEETLSEFPRKNLNKLSLSPKLFRGTSRVFKSIRYVTNGEKVKYDRPGSYVGQETEEWRHGFWSHALNKDYTMFPVVLGNAFIGYSEAYAATVIVLAVTGSATCIAEAPVALLRSIFAPRKKLKNFMAGNPISLSDEYYTSLLTQIINLAKTSQEKEKTK